MTGKQLIVYPKLFGNGEIRLVITDNPKNIKKEDRVNQLTYIATSIDVQIEGSNTQIKFK